MRPLLYGVAAPLGAHAPASFLQSLVLLFNWFLIVLGRELLCLYLLPFFLFLFIFFFLKVHTLRRIIFFASFTHLLTLFRKGVDHSVDLSVDLG